MQERRNSIANALELRLPCTKPLICPSCWNEFVTNWNCWIKLICYKLKPLNKIFSKLLCGQPRDKCGKLLTPFQTVYHVFYITVKVHSWRTSKNTSQQFREDQCLTWHKFHSWFPNIVQNSSDILYQIAALWRLSPFQYKDLLSGYRDSHKDKPLFTWSYVI